MRRVSSFFVSASGTGYPTGLAEGRKEEGRKDPATSFQRVQPSFTLVSDLFTADFQAHTLLQSPPSAHHPELWL